jgi:hypothetical protein
MKVMRVCLRDYLCLLKYCLATLSLLILGCASAPNLLYIGSDDLLEYPLIRNAAADQDYPIVVTTSPNQASIQIRWSQRGDWIWWETTPFTKASKVQFKLYKPDMSVLCESAMIPNSDQRYTCQLPVKDNTSKALLGELNYWFKDNPSADDLPYSVSRTYYLIERP